MILLVSKLLGQTNHSLDVKYHEIIENKVVDLYVYLDVYNAYTNVSQIDSIYQLLQANIPTGGVQALNTMAYSIQLSTLGHSKRGLDTVKSLSNDLANMSPIIRSEYFYTMGTISLKSMKPTFAVEYYERSVKIIKGLDDVPKEIIQSKIIALGNSYGALQKYEEAQKQYSEALTYERFGKNRNSLALRFNIAIVNSDLGKLEEAKKYWLEVLPFVKESKNHYIELKTYHNLGDVYHRQDSLERACLWYSLGLKKAKQHNFNSDVFGFHYRLSEVFYKRRQLDSAYMHLVISDSLEGFYNTNEMTRSLTEMEVHYKEKEQRLEHKMLQDLYVTEQEKRFILLLSCLLLLGLCIVFMWQMRVLDQKNTVLLRQQLKSVKSVTLPKTTTIRRSSNIDYSKLLEQLTVKIEEKKIFTESNLTLENLAKQLYTNRTYLSEAINSHYQKSFSQWLNELRVLESKKMLSSSEYDQYSIEGIARNVGFSSTSAFNSNFKKITGLTPSYFRKNRSSTF